jgi:hypothetical protein
MTQKQKFSNVKKAEKNLDNTKVTSNKYLPYQSEEFDSEDSRLFQHKNIQRALKLLEFCRIASLQGKNY